MLARIPAATRTLLLAFAAVFVLQQLMPLPMLRWFALWPDVGPILIAREQGQPLFAEFAAWQWLSYGFLHGNLTHLLLNGLALFMFGSLLEQHWGAARFAFFVLTCIVGAGITQWWVVSASAMAGQGAVAPTLGASGGVFGVLLAYGVMFPRHRVMLLIPPIPMPAWLLVAVFAAAATVLGLTGAVPGIAHFAHLGGMATGLVMYITFGRHWNRFK